MADAAKRDQTDQFKNLTGVNEERARFYLESAAWQLDVAVSNFYEGEDDGMEMMEDVTNEPKEPSPPPPQSLGSLAAVSSASSRSTSSKKSSRFGTIGSLRENEKSDSEEEGQAFYAGGSEESGEMILGPPKKKGASHEFVEGLFKSAKEHGAKEVGLDEPRSKQSGPIFHGSGYRLGEEEGGSEVVVRGPAAAARENQIEVTLTFWKDGFSLDDGPLRDFNDAANKPFLASIQKGEIPDELLAQAKGGKVDVNMVDKHTEDFVQAKPKVHAFSGAGHMLGSPTPQMAAQPSPAASTAPPPKTVSVDNSKPTTQIQIRLANGSRLIAKLNHSHTVGDIRSHIISSHPEYAQQTFVLMTTFPNKELTDDSQTLQAANLINAVVVQRLK